MSASSAEQVEEVFQGLRSFVSLHDLFIDSTLLTANNMATLSSSLTINKSLHRLILLDCNLDDHAVQQLSAGLHMNNSLIGLDLSSNPRITDTGVRHLADMLTVNNTLQYLLLSYNDAITNAGAVSLSNMLMVNKSLSTLYLEGTSIGEEGADALMESVLHNEVVTEVWLPDELVEYCMSYTDEVKNVLHF